MPLYCPANCIVLLEKGDVEKVLYSKVQMLEVWSVE